tara:strand:+ start:6153 stop:9413 length:3261 start_codon:yes stop_codon:yes gene_type:complete
MAETQPQVKVNRVKLYKMISYKGTKNSASQKKYTPLTAAKAIGDMEQDVTSGMKGLLGGLNSLGATLNTIGLAVEGIAEQMKTTVATQIRAQSKILSSAKDGLKAEKKRNKDEARKKKKEKEKEERDKEEDQSEKGKAPLFAKIKKEFAEGTKKAFGGLFGGLARMALSLFTFFIGYKILDWMSKNPEKVEAIAKTLAAVGKFIFNVTGFLVGSAMDGLIRFLENPVSIQGLFGMVQFIASAAPLFIGMAFLKNPIKTARALAWVIGSLGKGIMNLFKAQTFAKKLKKFSSSKFGKIALSAGAGVIAATAVSAAGGDTAEAIGAGVGAGAGQAIGSALGEATGIPGAGAIAGAAGAFVGGGIGKAVGPMMEPIFKPIGDFFKMVGDVFKAIFDPIKDALGGFFEALGGFMNGVLDAVEPHLPLIKKILGIGVAVAFAPLFLGIKALTAVLKFFTPKGEKDKKGADKSGSAEVKPKAMGGPVEIPVQVPTPAPIAPPMAEGGQISAGPIAIVQSTLQQVGKYSKGLSDLMLLPFKAIGVGILSTIGFISNIFGSFLPGPLKALMGNMLSPIAALFGLPMSIIKGGSKKGVSIGEEGAEDQEIKERDYDGELLEKFVGNQGVNALMGKLIAVMASAMVGKGAIEKVSSFAGNVIGGVKNFFGFSEGGALPERAAGGWIHGPMSGYPVSLDGGKSTSFIGHGTEWVGYKKYAKGGAFVVPFNTPATKRNRGLTAMRMREASAGGYAMPKFAEGGAFTPTIPKFAEGGKFDPDAFHNDDNNKNTSGVVVGDKTYYVKYVFNEGNVKIKQLSKRVEAGFMGIGEKLTSVRPGTDEFKTVIESDAFKKELGNQNKSKANSRGRGSKPLPIKSIKIHDQADIAWKHDQSFKQNKALFIKQGVPEEDANKLAARAAMELAIPSKDGKATVTATQRGEENLVVNKEGQTADELKPPTPAKDGDDGDDGDDGEDGKNTIEGMMAQIEKIATKGLTEFSKAVPAIKASQGSTSGETLQEAKLDEQSKLNEKITAAFAETSTPQEFNTELPPMNLGGADTEGTPIVIPDLLNEMDADPYLKPRFGLVTEFTTEPVNFF